MSVTFWVLFKPISFIEGIIPSYKPHATGTQPGEPGVSMTDLIIIRQDYQILDLPKKNRIIIYGREIQTARLEIQRSSARLSVYKRLTVIFWRVIIFDAYNQKKNECNISAALLSTAELNGRRWLFLSDSEQLKLSFPLTWTIEMLSSLSRQKAADRVLSSFPWLSVKKMIAFNLLLYQNR